MPWKGREEVEVILHSSIQKFLVLNYLLCFPCGFIQSGVEITLLQNGVLLEKRLVQMDTCSICSTLN